MRHLTIFGCLLLCLIGPTACWNTTPMFEDRGGDSAGSSGGSGAGNATNTTSSHSSTGGTSSTATGEPPKPPSTDGYYVDGNQIFASDGTPHVFRGVARPSLEWNKNGEYLSASDYQLIASWNANVVRIALNQGFWLQGSIAYAPEYRDTIAQNVAWAHEAGLDVILDLHWSDRGNFNNWPEQQQMADQNSIAFWKSVAEEYKNDKGVLFELYNEPYGISWEIWKNGGNASDGFTAVGMQALYDAVRSTGADNLVLIGGIHWAYDLSGVPGHRISGNNIVYVAHLYNYSDKMPGAWDNDWGFLTQTDPVFITEFGNLNDCATDYVQQVVNYAASRQLSWTAWAWFVGGCNFPSLISDWSGQPTAAGQLVKSAMLGN